MGVEEFGTQHLTILVKQREANNIDENRMESLSWKVSFLKKDRFILEKTRKVKTIKTKGRIDLLVKRHELTRSKEVKKLILGAKIRYNKTRKE